MPERQAVRRIQSSVVALLSLFCADSFAESYQIRVTDMTGQPLPDAVVALNTAGYSSPAKTIRIMDQIDRQFSPHVLAVNAGDLVSFPNSDNIRHHVYSFSEAKAFEIKLYADRPESPIDFLRPGIVVLGCNIHDDMVGYIYVTPEGQSAAVTDKNGYASVSGAGELKSVSIWHERLSVMESEQTTLGAEALENYRSGDYSFLITVDPEVPPREPAGDHVHHGFGNSMRR